MDLDNRVLLFFLSVFLKHPKLENVHWTMDMSKTFQWQLRIVVARLLFRATMQVLAFDSEQECLEHMLLHNFTAKVLSSWFCNKLKGWLRGKRGQLNPHKASFICCQSRGSKGTGSVEHSRWTQVNFRHKNTMSQANKYVKSELPIQFSKPSLLCSDFILLNCWIQQKQVSRQSTGYRGDPFPLAI